MRKAQVRPRLPGFLECTCEPQRGQSALSPAARETRRHVWQDTRPRLAAVVTARWLATTDRADERGGGAISLQLERDDREHVGHGEEHGRGDRQRRGALEAVVMPLVEDGAAASAKRLARTGKGGVALQQVAFGTGQEFCAVH